MRKIILLAVFMAFSCSSSDDNGPKAPTFNVDLLLKGWAYDKIIIEQGEFDYSHNPGCNLDYFGFRNRPGQEYQFEEIIHTFDYCASSQTFLEWEPDGDHVNLYFGDYFLGELVIVNLTDNSLEAILEADFDGDGTREQQHFKAIPYDPYDSF